MFSAGSRILPRVRFPGTLATGTGIFFMTDNVTIGGIRITSTLALSFMPDNVTICGVRIVPWYRPSWRQCEAQAAELCLEYHSPEGLPPPEHNVTLYTFYYEVVTKNSK
jgi:hypothetical protein